jgi:membrane-associated protein
MLKTLLDFFLHIDVHLGQIISTYGLVTYLILFGTIFVETGLVFVPFLPGDSLLFAAGALAALGSFNIWLLVPFMMLAAILGDTINYWIGHFFGQKLVDNPHVPIKKEHIEETQRFFDRHGGKTIILARFVPIVRTFAPFVAGIGKMRYSEFISYNIIGGTAWVALATLTGFFFGNIPFVKHNFSVVVLGIVIISVVPMMIPLMKRLVKHD